LRVPCTAQRRSSGAERRVVAVASQGAADRDAARSGLGNPVIRPRTVALGRQVSFALSSAGSGTGRRSIAGYSRRWPSNGSASSPPGLTPTALRWPAALVADPTMSRQREGPSMSHDSEIRQWLKSAKNRDEALRILAGLRALWQSRPIMDFRATLEPAMSPSTFAISGSGDAPRDGATRAARVRPPSQAVPVIPGVSLFGRG
jgi:hypothetical protein